MNNTEALYGFFRWLADSPRVYHIGGGYHGGDVHAALAAFCAVNELPYLEEGWQQACKLPTGTVKGVTQSQAKEGYVDASSK